MARVSQLGVHENLLVEAGFTPMRETHAQDDGDTPSEPLDTLVKSRPRVLAARRDRRPRTPWVATGLPLTRPGSPCSGSPVGFRGARWG
jgi:hypothetical protein